jgi:hypothetical protein
MSENLNFKTADEYAAARDKFFESHPDAPEAEDVECLSLIMRREYAEQILRGEKPLEFRQYSEFYVKRLIDPDVSDYIRAHFNDDEVMMFCNDIRQVKKIHFHNYNNSWFLDIECDFNDAFSITKHDIEFLQSKYGVHDFDDDLKRMEAVNVPQNERPWLFYFVCGEVLDTNLEVKPKEEEFVEICGGITVKDPVIDEMIKDEDDGKILKLKVNKDTFKEIAGGQLKSFSKEITPKNLSMFFITEEKGAVKEINGVPQLRMYDAIQFINKDGSYTCKINNADVVFLDEEYGNMIPYLELEDDIDYTDCMIAYDLGDKI